MLDSLVKKPNVLVHAFGVFDWKGALLLEYDGIVLAILDRLQRFSGIPMGTQRGAARADQAMSQSPATCGCQSLDQIGEVVACCETVADEQDILRFIKSFSPD